MAQPPAYNQTTDFSQDEASAVAGRSTVRTERLDAEFVNLKTTLDAVLANLVLIQRDDGELADQVVELHALSSSVRALVAAAGTNPRGAWVTATAYAVKDVVTNSTGTYLCATAHTSGVFATDLAANKWIVIFDTAAFVATGVAFTPVGTIAAGNVQAAIAEVASEAAQKASNLSDLANAATARGNLGFPAVGAGQVGQIITTNPAAADALIWTDYSREPINVNPNWLIDQINEGALYTISGGASNGPDAWTGNATGAGVFKLRTIADPDNAALKCLEITCTTADASIAATDDYRIFTVIEGYDSADLKPGTASASQITIRFAFKSNVTGVYGVAVSNSAANRRYIGTITVPDANENTYTVTLTLDTGGTWLYTNGAGLVLTLTLAAGSNFQAAAGSWGAGAERTTSAQCNFMSANTNVAYLKRFHIIPGGVALAYHKQDIERELRKVQRQYRKSYDTGVAVAAANTNGRLRAGADHTLTGAAVGERFANIQFSAPMRAVPTAVFYRPSNGATGSWDDGGGNPIAMISEAVGMHGFLAINNANVATNTVLTGHYTANARLS